MGEGRKVDGEGRARVRVKAWAMMRGNGSNQKNHPCQEVLVSWPASSSISVYSTEYRPTMIERAISTDIYTKIICEDIWLII